MESFDIAVVGAGPAGLFAAVTAASAGLKVGVLEKKKHPGLKLLASGAGRCNLTRREPPERFFSRYGGKERFVRPCLMEFPPESLEAFFSRRGVPLTEMPGGKLFPASDRSRDVLDALLTEAERQGVRIIAGTPVSELRPGGSGFLLDGVPGGAEAASVILAAGGCSYPGTGSAGDGFRLAENLGHTIISPAPALTPVELEKHPFGDLAGISLPAALDLVREGKKLRRITGDLLFTHRGLSGPVILDASRYMKPGDRLLLDTAGCSPAEMEEDILTETASSGRLLVKTLLQRRGLPERLVLLLLERAGISREGRLAELGKKQRNTLTGLACAFPLKIAALGGWNTAMVTAGGVDTCEVNSRTMESRIVPGLFFAGEVLDVDGDTGGYNLQFAFSSGYLAGLTLSRSFPKEPAGE